MNTRTTSPPESMILPRLRPCCSRFVPTVWPSRADSSSSWVTLSGRSLTTWASRLKSPANRVRVSPRDAKVPDRPLTSFSSDWIAARSR
ncbi:hypothetical protein ACFQY7_29800 [Actinomadura luteofluorescens]|uniref:hypothetical protein n=1 Tax=Actinomadura luteofluorescens TaxID=46163 RepID=UPI00363F4296